MTSYTVGMQIKGLKRPDGNEVSGVITGIRKEDNRKGTFFIDNKRYLAREFPDVVIRRGKNDLYLLVNEVREAA